MSLKTRCNGCGYCCIRHRQGCGLSIARHGYFIDGTCPDLIWNGYRHMCQAVMKGRGKVQNRKDMKIGVRCELTWNLWRKDVKPRGVNDLESRQKSVVNAHRLDKLLAAVAELSKSQTVDLSGLATMTDGLDPNSEDGTGNAIKECYRLLDIECPDDLSYLDVQ